MSVNSEEGGAIGKLAVDMGQIGADMNSILAQLEEVRKFSQVINIANFKYWIALLMEDAPGQTDAGRAPKMCSNIKLHFKPAPALYSLKELCRMVVSRSEAL